MDFVTNLVPLKKNKLTILLVITDWLRKGTVLIPINVDNWLAEGIAKQFLRYYMLHY